MDVHNGEGNPLKSLIKRPFPDRPNVMRRGVFSLVGFLCLWVSVKGADSDIQEQVRSIFFQGADLVTAASNFERLQRVEPAIERYLQARECFIQLAEKYPTYQAGTVRNRLKEIDAKLEPLLISQAIDPKIHLTPPKIPQAVAQPAVPAIPATHGGNAAIQPYEMPVQPGTPGSGSKPLLTSRNYELLIAQLNNRVQQLEQQIAAGRIEREQIDATHQAQLREALAARPKAVEPGELAKQTAANETLENTNRTLLTQNRKDRDALGKALAELKRLEGENAQLLQRLSDATATPHARQLLDENQRLRKQLIEQRRLQGNGGSDALRQELVTERALRVKIEQENRKLRELLLNPVQP